MHSVFFSNNARNFLKNADGEIKQKISRLVETLKLFPVPVKEHDVVKLAGTDDMYRIRISSFRIIYRIFWNSKEIHILKIERKSETTYK